ncbi:hypothetical protein CDV55_105195 [Aspergillus turcosus]|uniref:Uncharacterized protein n=1 Tax=Aspergillus turcosus TaxID=1245748 RepID=A0A397HNX0_9EURO|nr:hypothetical protein CDV55_105195 [Aspergillus turcosus]RLL99701.1 hypothetical protein CFD26_103901 [Aspergillus turcosus]
MKIRPFKTTLTWHKNRVRRSVVKASNHSAQQIFNEIRRSLPGISEYTEIVYSLSRDDAELICRSLLADSEVERKNLRINYNSYTGVLRLKIMPISLHDVHQRWINCALVHWGINGIINSAEADLLWSGVGTSVHQGSVKQPDHFLRVDTDPDPRIVVESGWSESFPNLRSDKNLWLKGNPSVLLVILLKWSALASNRIKGTAEVWRRDTTGNLVSFTMPIFPAPVPLPQNELLQFTKGDLFRPALLPGQAIDSAAVWALIDTDPATKDIINGYIHHRAKNYGHAENIKGAVKNNVVEWSKDLNVLPAVLAPAAPQVGVLGVKATQLPEVTVLWFVVQLMRTTGSLFPCTTEFPITVAYAMTVHKSQGITPPQAVYYFSFVERLLPSKREFDSPDERKYGSLAIEGPVSSSNAYQEAYPRPRFSPKKNDLWLDFIDNGGQLIHRSFVYLDPNHRDDRFNNEAALDLLQLHLEELETALKGFAEKQIKWRCDRRKWELDVVKWLYTKHNDYLGNHSNHSKTTEDDSRT